MKGLIYFIIFFAFAITAKGQEDELVCLNLQCFVPEEIQPTVVLKDSLFLEQEVNQNFNEMVSAADAGRLDPEYPIEPQETEVLEDYLFQNSKYYQPLNSNTYLRYRSFMYVASRDMIWATHPEYESTRPNFRYYFNEPPPVINIIPD